METFKTRLVFLWCLAAIYLFAFVSLYFQIPGLYGKDGILPAKIQLKQACLDKHDKCHQWATNEECENNPAWMHKNCEVSCKICKDERTLVESFWQKPTLLWFAAPLNLSVDTMMDLLCIIGTAVSFGVMTSSRMRNCFSFALLWFLYFSLYQVGQTFLWFQWDILLLETGFLGIILSPFGWNRITKDRPRFGICFWLVKWLIFRLMFQSGVVKLTSHCHTWWGLTALNYHYESQCLPTQIAWYAHQLPEWFQRLSVAMTFVIEIGIPFLFFFPMRSIRIFAFYAQLMLQILIILTGNYNFFNLLTTCLCFSLLDDQFFLHNLPGFITNHLFTKEDKKRLAKKQENQVVKIISSLTKTAVAMSLFYWTVKLFDLRMDDKSTLLSRVAFSKEDFSKFLEYAVPISIGIGLFSFLSAVASAFQECFQSSSTKEKVISSLQTTVYFLIAVCIFSVSLVPYTDIDRGTQSRIWPVVRRWHAKADHLQLTNAYGLFRSMTGVGGRPEIIIEGSDSLQGPWKEYHFRYKPGKLTESPTFLIPHQPRLDWQMWFAALSSYQYNPWFINLIDKLLNDNKDVLALLGENPFPNKAPQFIKSTLYSYHYTRLSKNTTSISDGLARSSKIKRWWRRDKPAEYTPILSKDNGDVKTFLRHHEFILDGKWPENADGRVHSCLQLLRRIVHCLDPTWTMLRIVFLALIICCWKTKVKT